MDEKENKENKESGEKAHELRFRQPSQVRL